MTKIFAQPMKFRTPTAADSERIQRALFAQGAQWMASDTKPQYTSSKFIFVSTNGCMTHGGSEDYFNKHDNVEYVIDRDGDVALPPPAVPARKVVEFDGQKYDVPGYTKFVTRDATGKSVFAWSEKPDWRGALEGYYTGKGQRERVYVYVEPKPEGCLMVEVA